MIDKFTRLTRSLPSLYKPETNLMIRGLLKAWGLSDDQIEIQIKNTKDQLFVATAEGRYLDFLGNNVGVPRDGDLGVSDEDFRKLIPVLSFYPKQVRKTIIALLDVFWGPGFTRANTTSQNTETFDFGPVPLLTGTASFVKGDKHVKGNGTQFLSELSPGDYIKASAASGTTYQKVSAIFSNVDLELSTEWAGDVYINQLVSKGIVRKLSYKVDNLAEKTIRFKPNAFSNLTTVTIDELVAFINADEEHNKLITASKFLDPQAGNKLNIRTNTAGLLGAIQITGGDANSALLLNFDLLRHTETKANVFEINPNEIVVKIPSSVPILRRNLKGAIHSKNTKKILLSNVAETFDFSGLGASSTLNIDVDGNPNTITFTHASAFANPAKATAVEVVSAINSQLLFLEAYTHTEVGADYGKVALRTTDGSQEYRVTGGTANSVLQFSTTIQQDSDLIVEAYPSSYIFDPIGQLFTVTGTTTELTNTVAIGSVLAALPVVNASSFPNKPGKILIDFGRSQQEGPINYNSRPNNSTLLIDASHVFQKEHQSGRKVNFISDGPTIPRLTGVDYAAYVVGTEAARAAAQKLIAKLIAAGVVIRFVIEFPEVLFECVCRNCGPSQSADYQGSLTGQGPLVF